MGGGPQVLFILAAVAIVIAIAVIGHLQEKKRREALIAWCRRQGLRFCAAKDPGFERKYPMFGCLRRGSNRYAKYRMEGELGGRPCVCFIYHYETHSTDSKGRRRTHRHYVSGAVVRSDVMLEDLLIRPENFLDKIAGVVGFDDIDFESAEFSRRFYVKARDRKWAYDVIHARTMEFLLEHTDFAVELCATYAMAWRDTTLQPRGLERAAGVVNGILDRLPNYLIEQQKEVT